MVGDHVISLDDLRASVAPSVGLAPADVPDDENLIALGMTSLELMGLVNEWRAAGLAVTYSKLVREPTVAGWWRHLNELADAGSAAVTQP